MTGDNLLSRISIDPNICFGKPCIKGHRIWVSMILDYLAGGVSVEELLEEYPGIEREDILACIAYGAEMSKGYFVEIQVSCGLFNVEVFRNINQLSQMHDY
jgi:uncharacterized protein (DUF433 family)